MSVTKMRIRLKDAPRWEHQNSAEYTGEYIEGVLTDNYVLACKRGWCFVYEATDGWYPNTPIYKFAAYKDKEACEELWNEWLDFAESVRLAEWMNELGRSAA